ncbi:MAG: HAD family hydrolase [Elusimicrobia bacterium]|nr:HAD family hydrolase [Elusimicrobiota bacterium]
MKNNFQLIIFDIDGTLVNTLDDIRDSANKVLKHFGIKKASKEKIKHSVGSGVDNFFSNLHVKDSNIKSAKKLFSENYLKNLTVKSKLYSGMLGVLKELKKEKIILYVVSNKPQIFSEKLLKMLKVKKYFKKIIGINSEEKKRLKPSAFYIRKILLKEKILPSEALIVGDSKTDILAAKNSKIFSCAVLYGFRKYGELEKYNPDFYVRKPVELMDIIK